MVTHPPRGGTGPTVEGSTLESARAEFRINSADILGITHNHPREVGCSSTNRDTARRQEIVNAYPSESDWETAERYVGPLPSDPGQADPSLTLFIVGCDEASSFPLFQQERIRTCQGQPATTSGACEPEWVPVSRARQSLDHRSAEGFRRFLSLMSAASFAITCLSCSSRTSNVSEGSQSTVLSSGEKSPEFEQGRRIELGGVPPHTVLERWDPGRSRTLTTFHRVKPARAGAASFWLARRVLDDYGFLSVTYADGRRCPALGRELERIRVTEPREGAVLVPPPRIESTGVDKLEIRGLDVVRYSLTIPSGSAPLSISRESGSLLAVQTDTALAALEHCWSNKRPQEA